VVYIVCENHTRPHLAEPPHDRDDGIGEVPGGDHLPVDFDKSAARPH
jgi:hypothetical protein